ncbi:HEAT repeat domain-containing protein [Algoriphagus halophilus]|uniref:HEAT repeat domain-containing protein n=1 Tax=Algoriphagus halophilus TaxID=226505 RepID=UPI00358F6315
MQEETQKLFDKICDPNEKEAFYFAEKLGKINTEEVKDKLIELVKGDNWEIAYLACKALAKTSFNNKALEAIFTAIRDKKNQKHQGAFVQVLEEFDLSESFVDIFRVYFLETLRPKH